ncbi:MAG: nitronate monooxygenase, partial [Candidatus Marinimicrobia bacterium]|nr:nitronate monooxygenase [Candidatus Neomarinimicrobiota bacterium]
YKQAIIDANESQIVLTDKLSGVPVSVIENEYIKRIGVKAGPIARWMLRGSRTKKYMRLFYTLRSFKNLKDSSGKSGAYQNYFQAGKSVAGITKVESVATIMSRYRDITESL